MARLTDGHRCVDLAHVGPRVARPHVFDREVPSAVTVVGDSDAVVPGDDVVADCEDGRPVPLYPRELGRMKGRGVKKMKNEFKNTNKNKKNKLRGDERGETLRR